jgi:hypothetical protein
VVVILKGRLQELYTWVLDILIVVHVYSFLARTEYHKSKRYGELNVLSYARVA